MHSVEYIILFFQNQISDDKFIIWLTFQQKLKSVSLKQKLRRSFCDDDTCVFLRIVILTLKSSSFSLFCLT